MFRVATIQSKPKRSKAINSDSPLNLLGTTLADIAVPGCHSFVRFLTRKRLQIVTEQVNNLSLNTVLAQDPFPQRLDGFSRRKKIIKDLEIPNNLANLLSATAAPPFVQQLHGELKRKKVFKDPLIPNILIGTLGLPIGIPTVQMELSASVLRQVYKRRLANKFIEIPNLLTSTLGVTDTTGHCNIYAIAISKRWAKRS